MPESASHTENSLPAEIVIEHILPTGTRYILPPHGFRKTGLAMIVGGLVELAFMVFWTNGWMDGFQAAFGAWGLVSAVVSVPFVIGGIALLGLGATLAFGHCEIEVDDDWLRWVERVGPFRWRRARPLSSVRQLSVETSKANNTDANTSSQDGVFCAIKVDTTGKPWWIALGYDRTLLAALAGRLAADCNAVSAQAGSATVVEVVEAAGGPARRTQQPAASQIVCERLDDGVTFDIPPAGLRKGSAGLFVFSLLWCGFMVFFSSFMLLVDNGPRGNDSWFVGGIVALFWLVGIVMLLSAVNMARRRAAVAVAGDVVMALQTGVFRSRIGEWQRADIKEIRVGPSGMEVNDRPVLQLQIVPVAGKTFGLLTGRDVAELEWMATLLGDALNGRTDALTNE